MIMKMNNEQIEFLRSRCGELTEGATIPKEVDEWVVDKGFGDGEEGYLVKLNGQYGFLYVEEYSHNEQTNGFQNDFALEHNLINIEVLERLNKLAEALSDKLNDSILVMVGDKTGFMESHELCLFFPYQTDNQTYKETLELFNQVGASIA